MIRCKQMDKIAAAAMAVALIILCICSQFNGREGLDTEDSGIAMAYEESLFSKDHIMTVDIRIEESQWQELLDNAIDEEYYACDVTVNGELFSSVGIRAKGNTSLSQVYSDETTDRYSFKIEFDHYIKNQTCNGLDKLVLNNQISDATYMKEYLTYDMFAFLGVPSSLCNYAKITVNGEDWGLYLALEAVEESFAERNYGADYGQLYKPEGVGGGGAGKMKDIDSAALDEMINGKFGSEQKELDIENTEKTAAENENDGQKDSQRQAPPNQNGDKPPIAQQNDSQEPPMPGQDDFQNQPMPEQNGEIPKGELPGGRMEGGNVGLQTGGFGDSSGGADLIYTDDDLDSYSTVWEGSVFDSSDNDHEKVVEALKQVSQGNELETYLDVENILKYLAVHTFVVNLDSLSGNMAHNYYLYEEDGCLSFVPWDYNLAFGGFQNKSALSAVNFPIDTPVTGVSMEKRPIFQKLLEVDEYKDMYHSYLRRLIEEYIGDSALSEKISQIRSLIDKEVASDPTAFYSYDEYEAGVEMLERFCYLRGESVGGQLDGTIPSTTEGQNEDSSSLVDASAVNLQTMGTQGGGAVGNMDVPEKTDEFMNKFSEQTERQEISEEFAERRDDSQMTGPQNNPGEADRSRENNQMALPDGMNGSEDGKRNGNIGLRKPQGFEQGMTEKAFAQEALWITAGCLGIMILFVILVKGWKRRKYPGIERSGIRMNKNLKNYR